MPRGSGNGQGPTYDIDTLIEATIQGRPKIVRQGPATASDLLKKLSLKKEEEKK
jgi:hypothetical protein